MVTFPEMSGPLVNPLITQLFWMLPRVSLPSGTGPIGREYRPAESDGPVGTLGPPFGA
jgi:hypothetical protein